MGRESLAACVAACGELLADEPELYADFMGVFAGPRPRWQRMPDDLRRGLADIAWDHLVARGLAPAAGDRSFILRSERRCETCGGAPPDPWYRRCEDCVDTGWEQVERRSERPPSLSAALVLAADAAAMLAAEALAREATARLWPWRGRRGAMPGPSPPPQTIAWRVDERGTSLELMRGTRAVCPLLFEALARAGSDLGRGPRSWIFEPLALAYNYRRQSQWPPEPQIDRAAALFYDELAALGVLVPFHGVNGAMPGTLNRRREPFPPVGRPFAELPNPFAPLCGLWDLEVALERLEADTIVLARRL